MSAQRTPKGEVDRGDGAYGDSIVTAARFLLDRCVLEQSKGGLAKGFSGFPSYITAAKVRYTLLCEGKLTGLKCH